MEWLWSEQNGGLSAAQHFRSQACPSLNSSLHLTGPLGERSATSLFDQGVYQVGAMLLQSLRERVGDAAFFRILKTWASGGTEAVTTADLLAIAEEKSGQDLDAFFNGWLRSGGGFVHCLPQASPPNLNASPVSGRGSTKIAWGALNKYGQPVDGFHVTVTDNATGVVAARVTLPSWTYQTTIGGLSVNSSYTVAVSAFSPAGDGAAAVITDLSTTSPARP